MSLADSLRKKKEGKTEVKIVSGAEKGKSFSIIRIQLEGLAGSGKSHFILQIIKHMHEVMSIPLDKILLCFMDCDKEGVAPLLFSQTIPLEYQECIQYTKCNNIWEAYDAFKVFDERLIEHKTKTGQDGWLVIENMGELWYFCQRDYVEAVYQMEYVQLLMERQEEAYARGKKTLPALDQMLDYRNINPLHNELANKATRGEYNLLWTAHPSTRKFQEGDEVVEKVVASGQKYNDARVDFILRLYKERGKWFADSRKLRGLNVDFNKLPISEASFTTFVTKYTEVLERDTKRRGVKMPYFRWVKKVKAEEVVEEADAKPSLKESKPKKSSEKDEEFASEKEEEDDSVEI